MESASAPRADIPHSGIRNAELITLAYDTEARKVGCVLLQAGLGGDSAFVQQHFDDSTWAVGYTEGMKLYRLSKDQWLRIATHTNRRTDKERGNG